MPQHDDDIIPHQDEVEAVIEQEVGLLIPSGFEAADAFPSSEILTPRTGWVNDSPYTSCYRDGAELVLGYLRFNHAAALAITGGDSSVEFIGDFAEDDVPPFIVGARGVLRTTAGVWKTGVTVFASTNGGFGFAADADVASTANLQLFCPALRVPHKKV